MDPYTTDENTYMPAFWNDGLEMYKKLVNDYHYSSSNVYLLSSRWYSKYDGSWAWRGENPSTNSRVYGEAMWDSSSYRDIKDALDEIASKITIHDSLMIVIIAHGGPGGFGIRADVPSCDVEEHPNTQATSLDYESFGYYLNSSFGNGNNRKYAVMVVVNQACFSGTMMPYLKGDNRILISAADSTHESWTMATFPYEDPYTHWAFLYKGRNWRLDDSHPGFILTMGNLKNPNSVEVAYNHGRDATFNNNDLPPSYPEIEAYSIDPSKIYW